jgi:cell division protein ZapE
VRAAFEALVEKGVLAEDLAQSEASALLAGIAAALEKAEGRARLPRLFSRPRAIPGAYVWGEVGRGKTMLMDLLFENTAIARKRRVHFHEFMDEVHREIAVFRVKAADDKGRRDPIPFVTRPIIAETRLLCLDEFHVNDIANAMLLGRLFESLFDGGVTLVATSNVPPDGLYHNGLNRQLVLPFIALLKRRTHVFELAAATDYRHLKLAGQKVFSFGAPERTRRDMDAIWQRLTGGRVGHARDVLSLGRAIRVPKETMGVARFSFAEICETPLSSRDYLRLAENFHSFIIDDVPRLGRTRSDAAKRFILLIDTLYDRRATLAAGFATSLDRLADDDKTAFEFKRTLSRLHEMQSEDYLAGRIGSDPQ